jgi:hypothetical protein
MGNRSFAFSLILVAQKNNDKVVREKKSEGGKGFAPSEINNALTPIDVKLGRLKYRQWIRMGWIRMGQENMLLMVKKERRWCC